MKPTSTVAYWRLNCNKARREVKQLQAKAKEYHDQYHLCEAKLLSHKAIIRQLQDKIKQLNSGEQTK